MEDADIYPNLEWMPSTSAQPGADHKIFWGTVLSKDDPFWSEHRPGDRWNCKCSLRQTDKEADKPSVRWKRGKGDEPQAGLRTKPGSGEIFSDDHPYFPKSCGACPYGKGGLRGLWSSLSGGKGNCGACRFIRTMIEQSDEAGGGGKNNGYTTVPTDRGKVRVHAKHGKIEKAANIETATYLANKYGYEYDLLPDEPGVKSADAYNETLKRKEEFKENKTPTENAGQRIFPVGG